MTKEQEIEEDLIARLVAQKYTYRRIHDNAALEKNFRKKFAALNRVELTDSEFARLRNQIIQADVFTAARILRERNTFQRDDGTPLQYTLVNISDWCKNDFEVINQLRINTTNSHHRDDVILLINGVPVVQIELKALGLTLTPRRAMQQIVEYKNDPGNGYTDKLLCFIQLFIVSNRSDTLYFANNHHKHFSFDADERFLPIYRLADKNNAKINHLHDFTERFLAKCALGQMISRYMVLVACEQKLMIMRPYQIYAVKAIVDCIQQNRGNGYIWHTTGSGKTLTSFKAATLLKDNPDIDKCLFVVDRKDLDRQTREEFNKFQEGCVEQNTNTEILVQRLLSDNYADKVIVTTIQKLGLALDENSERNRRHKKRGRQTYKERLAPLRERRMVFIFDECHRSQFGDNHQAIKDFFPNAQLFGFTGTPIFEDNATYTQIDGTMGSYKTTEAIFQKQLHAYTITHAIEDQNVLGFNIGYFGETTMGDNGNSERRASSPESIVAEIIKKHNSATNQRRFNALLATASINKAIEYYRLFKRMQAEKLAEDENYAPLNIACVFSPPADVNKDVQQIQEDLPQEKLDNQKKPAEKKAALQEIIVDYNNQYGANHSINEFDLYYQDVQQRIKDQQYPNRDYSRENKIDITIVVDMLLTGFDSKYLNTLYVDKTLKYHGLIQAFSRTNRVLNDTKPYGNILDFRGQQEAVDTAITRFSGQDQDRAKEIWLVDPAPKVIEKLHDAVVNLETFMASQDLDCTPENVNNLQDDAARSGFINQFKEVQRLKTQLDQYTDLDQEQVERVNKLLPEEQLRGFKGMYLETAQRLKEQQAKDGEPNDPVQQLEFELVLFGSALIDYDYIIRLIAASTHEPGRQKMSRQQLIDLISSNANLMDERDTIVEYINSLPANTSLNEKAIHAGYQQFKADKNTQELADIAAKHDITREALQDFVDNILGRMIFDGEKLGELLAPLGLGWKARSQKELALMEDLIPLLKRRAEGRDISGLKAYE